MTWVSIPAKRRTELRSVTKHAGNSGMRECVPTGDAHGTHSDEEANACREHGRASSDLDSQMSQGISYWVE